jgi:hypothetical protein
MRKILVFLVLSAVAGAGHAQVKCWNEGAKRVCGDAPPPGAKVTTLRTPSGPTASAPAAGDGAKDAKAAKRGPLTPAEQEQEYRKRQAEAKKGADQLAVEQKDAARKRDNCERAREALRTYESGGRLARTDAKGERYFLDESQVAEETAKSRQNVKESCG